MRSAVIVRSAGLVVMLGAATAWAAQPGFPLPAPNGAGRRLVVSVGEDCKATIRLNGGPAVVQNCFLDPNSNPPNVPTFTLPTEVEPGDVVVTEGFVSSVMSDVLRFPPVAPNVPFSETMQFFSEEPEVPPATEASDIGLPPMLLPNNVTIQEPLLGFARYVPNGMGQAGLGQYEIRSDPAEAEVSCITDADCDDGNPCTDDECRLVNTTCDSTGGAFICQHTFNTAPCNDGHQCSTNDTCSAGECRGTPCHFECYELRRQQLVPPLTVALEDQFGSTENVTIKLPERMCAPADKNGENPSAPSEAVHLIGYRARHPFTRRNRQVVVNQFGTLVVDVLKAERILVPGTKSLMGPAPAFPTDGKIDHFQCYRVKQTSGFPRFARRDGIQINDQLGPTTLSILKPVRLCAPLNKDGETPEAVAHADHLMCYKTTKPRFGEEVVALNDQLGPIQRNLLRREEFCVPSVKNPPLCGNGALDPGEQCDPPDTQAGCAANQVCDIGCQCQPLANFCTDTTPITPAADRCVFPPENYGVACNVDTDCDSAMGAGDGLCRPRQHRGLMRPLQGGWNAINALDVAMPTKCALIPRTCSEPPGNVGNNCTADDDCELNDGVCQLGEPCTVNADCDNPALAGNGICTAGECTAPATCAAPAAQAGDPCTDDEDCNTPGTCGQICTEDADCDNPPGSGNGACGDFGTLGSFPRRDADGAMVLLSNNHVFARHSSNVGPMAALGEDIVQPPVGPVAGKLADYELVCETYGGDCTRAGGRNQMNAQGANCIDAAIGTSCSVGVPILDDGDILDVGEPAPFASPGQACGAPMSKFGDACAEDTDCDDPSNGVCDNPGTLTCLAPPASVGLPCTKDTQCDDPKNGVCGLAANNCPNLVTNTALNKLVKKSGARTGLTCGRVTSIGRTFFDGKCVAPPANVGNVCGNDRACDPPTGVCFPNTMTCVAPIASFNLPCAVNADCNPPTGQCQQEIYPNQLKIQGLAGFDSNGNFGCGGDSGSLIVGLATNEPVGLLFAGNNNGCTPINPPSITDANPIDLVLRRFKLHF